MRLKLSRPLVFFDLETTGLNISQDRIVELSYYKLFPNGTSESKTFRVKPVVMDMSGNKVQMHIPAEASAIHGIYDDDLKDCPTFAEIAAEVANIIADADLAGYNSLNFDLPLLAEEFIRAGVNIDLKSKKMIDAFAIFTRFEPRNLSAAYRFYCGKQLDDAHTAQADTMATYEVLCEQTERYADLPDTVDALAAYLQTGHKYADFAGRIGYDKDGKEIFNFGKYKGMRVEDVFRRDKGYYQWLYSTDFPQYTKQVFTRIYLNCK